MSKLGHAANDLMLAHYREEYARSQEMQTAVLAVALADFRSAIQSGIEKANKRLEGYCELMLADWMIHLHKAGNENRFTSLYVNTLGRPGVIRFEMHPPGWSADYTIVRMGKDEYKWSSGENDYYTGEQLADEVLTMLLKHTGNLIQGRL